MRGLRRPKVAGWAAVDLSNSGVWGVRVEPPTVVDGQPRVVACRGFDGTPTEDRLREVVSAVVQPGFGLVSILDIDDYQLLLGERPAVRPEEMGQSLRWALEAKLEYPAGEAYLAWFNVPVHESTQNRPRQQYVVAAKQSVVNERITRLERAGGRVDAIDVRETARRNLAALIEQRTGSSVCLIVPEAAGLQITVTYGGELYLERLIRERVLETTDPETRERQLDRIAVELQRTLDYLRRNTPFITLNDLLFAPSDQGDALREGLASRLGEPLNRLALDEFFTFGPDVDLQSSARQGRSLTALGAALRYRESVVE